ncbi:carboxymuconolactone decarboxylase family protein [Chitinophaga cymbidii]|uniref:Carboxymuconolactone decarboxylase-like domain-containing protein n=1 Tax=Chitinophaga cymbidii TaxID=1096750 RepID=A0A512RFH5_9BACT|nr:carboxymuconolactone decarboxylase family protein [Chitinophaga cymbidii]GEP94459.1 hypothetical protein CCY01nite_07190 [Chitinophaga cymbidii]
MSERIRIKKEDPDAYKAILALEAYISRSRINPLHLELIKIRASQLNGCAFCIDIHTRDARAKGETEQRLYALSAWRETPFFSGEERAILALTEEVTLISGGVSDETYGQAAKLFDGQYLSQLIMAIITINVWTRIGVSTRMVPGKD